MIRRWPIWLAFIGVSSCGNVGGDDQLTDIQRDYIEQMAEIQFGDQEQANVRGDIIWPQTFIYLNGKCAQDPFEMSMKGPVGTDGGASYNVMTNCLGDWKKDEAKFIADLAKESRYRQRRASVFDISKNPIPWKFSENVKYLDKQVYHTNLILNFNSKNDEKISENVERSGFFANNKFCSLNYSIKDELYSILSVSIHLKSFEKDMSDNETDPKRISKIVLQPEFAECILRANLLATGLMVGNAKKINVKKYSPVCLDHSFKIQGAVSPELRYRCKPSYDKFGKYISKIDLINPQLGGNLKSMDRKSYVDFLKKNINKIQLDDDIQID